MKTLITLALSAFALTTQGTIITVSIDPDRPGMFNTLQAAYDSCSDSVRDSLQLFSLPTGTFGDFTFDKPLYIHGNGYDVSTPSYVSGLGIIYMGPNSTGSILEGLDIRPVLFVNAPITIRNCRMRQVFVQASGHVTAINNVIITDPNGNGGNDPAVTAPLNDTSTVFYNNVIGNRFGAIEQWLIREVRHGLFANNFFYSWESPGMSLMHHQGTDYNTLYNNIILDVPDVSSECDYCLLTHNLVTGSVVDSNLVDDIWNQQGSNNKSATPQGGSGYTGGPWSFVDDSLQLASASPGNDWGLDGTDVGVFGGSNAMIPGSYHNHVLKVSRYIDSFLVANPAVLLDCPVHFTAGAHMLQYTGMAEQRIVGAEVYFDADPGPGQGIPLSLDTSAVVALDVCLDTTLSIGSHRMCVRFQADSGLWSSPRASAIQVLSTPCTVAPCSIWDCPGLQANFGDPCEEDGDPDTENGIGTNCTCDTLNLILPDPLHQSSVISISPNQAKDRVRVNWAHGHLRSTDALIVMNALGRVVYNRTGIIGCNMDLDIAHLAPGAYFVKLQGNQWQAHGRFIKE